MVAAPNAGAGVPPKLKAEDLAPKAELWPKAEVVPKAGAEVAGVPRKLG